MEAPSFGYPPPTKKKDQKTAGRCGLAGCPPFSLYKSYKGRDIRKRVGGKLVRTYPATSSL